MKIESISIEGFRGFNQQYPFRMDKRLTVFLGPNGTGKTSFCDAIEWSILGKLPEYSSVEATLEDVIINRNNPNREAKVTITFSNRKTKTEIQRIAKSKNVWKPTRTAKLQLLAGKEEEIKIIPETFRATVYLRQEALRKFIDEKPEKRRPVLSSLLGLEFVDALEKGTREAVNLISTDKETAEGTFSELKETIERYDEEYKSLNSLRSSVQKKRKLTQNQLGILLKPSCIISKSKEIYNKLQKIGKSMDLQIPVKFKEDLPTVDSFLELLPGVISEWKSKNSENLEQFERWAVRYEEVKQEIKQFDEDSIGNEIQELNREFKLKEEALKISDAFTRLLISGEEFLKSKKPEKCPLCNSRIPPSVVIKRIGTLRSKLKEAKEIETLQEGISELRQKITGLEGELTKLGRLKKEKTELEKKLAAPDYQAATEIGKKLKDISPDAQLLMDLNTISKKEKDLARIKLPSKKQINDAENKAKKVDYLHKMVQFLCDQLRELTTAVISKRIVSLAPVVNKYAKILSPHPTFSKLQIMYNEQGYWLQGISEEGKRTFVQTLFSTGQLNEAAVLILLAMAKKAPHAFEFVILDDPSQSLDEDGKRRLARLLVEASKDKQIITSTMDGELAKFVKSYYPQAKLYQFTGYNDEKGPMVRNID